MTYDQADRRDMEGGKDVSASPMEGGALPPRFWTFGMVEERLVEAMITLWRLDDPERNLLRARSKDGPWHLVMPEPGDYDARGGLETGGEVTIKPASLTRAEYAEMEEALGWVDRHAPRDAKLIGLALGKLAAGRREVPWHDLVQRMGMKRGSDGLRMRYGRALNAICIALNGGNPQATRVKPDNVQGR